MTELNNNKKEMHKIFWKISCDFYASNTVKKELLYLQDKHNKNVNQVLLALWFSSSQNRQFKTSEINQINKNTQLIKQWINEVRKLNRRLKKYQSQINGLREKLLNLELRLEKQHQKILINSIVLDKKHTASPSDELFYLNLEKIFNKSNDENFSMNKFAIEKTYKKLILTWVDFYLDYYSDISEI